jgi:hypothetical protein
MQLTELHWCHRHRHSFYADLRVVDLVIVLVEQLSDLNGANGVWRVGGICCLASQVLLFLASIARHCMLKRQPHPINNGNAAQQRYNAANNNNGNGNDHARGHSNSHREREREIIAAATMSTPPPSQSTSNGNGHGNSNDHTNGEIAMTSTDITIHNE